MQPWNFLRIEDTALKAQVYEHFRDVNARAAQLHGGDRQATYQALKLQGILDAPLNLLVTCDRSRGGPHVLGRTTMPEMDLYSTCLAVQNLWLAARAEGLGVGWMSLMEPQAIRALLGLPEAVVPVAYLCVGYPVDLPPDPLLGRVGWREGLELADLVFENRWGVTRPSRSVDTTLTTASEPVFPAVLHPRVPVRHGAGAVAKHTDFLHLDALPDDGAVEALRDRLGRLPTPPGALGELEGWLLRLAKIQGLARPVLERPWVVVFAGDHGVAKNTVVSAYQPEATALMVYRFLSGGGVINALAREVGAGLVVADVGVDHDFGAAEALVAAKVRRGTRDITREAAMTPSEFEAAWAAGYDLVMRLEAPDGLVLGELGIGNTTAAAAVLAGYSGLAPEVVVGSGSGVGPAGLARKQAALEKALHRHGAACLGNASEALRCLGGYELVAIVGAIEAAAVRGIPVLLDGFIVGVAALLAVMRLPACEAVLLGATRSAETLVERCWNSATSG
jgi:nicotinate-nucleotide--dimethylbenzimidazole phosphoribosyltransferase